jgi:hypothetical protein
MEGMKIGIIKYAPMKILIMALLLSTMLFATSACSSGKVSLGQKFSLGIGESANIKGEQLKARFLEVTEDSRCPTGVVCVWAGRVSCLVEITYGGSLESVILTEPGSNNFPVEQTFHEYKISYHIEPYPQAGTQIAVEEYRLALTISK